MTAEHVARLEYGKHFSMLKRHLNSDHKLMPDEFRRKWDLPPFIPTRRAELRKDTVGAREDDWSRSSQGYTDEEHGKEISSAILTFQRC